MIQFNPWDLVIFEGFSSKNGMPWRSVSIKKNISFNDSLIDSMVREGVEVVKIDKSIESKKK